MILTQWNSMTEILSAGVQSTCWPFEGDQMTNCKSTCVEWCDGLEISEVTRIEVEKLASWRKGDKRVSK